MNKKRTALDKEQKEELENQIKEQIEKHNKLLKSIFIWLGFLVIAFAAVYLFVGSMKHIDYKGIDFEREEYCDAKPCLIFYKIAIPIIYEDKLTGKAINADYNIFIRNDPRELDKVPVKGNVSFRKNLVLGVNTENLFCDGDWPIAIGNLQKLDVLGVKVIARNESEIKVYLPAEEYMYVNIREAKEGEKTSIEQANENNYYLNVADCEILEATERLMLEAFVQALGKDE